MPFAWPNASQLLFLALPCRIMRLAVHLNYPHKLLLTSEFVDNRGSSTTLTHSNYHKAQTFNEATRDCFPRSPACLTSDVLLLTNGGFLDDESLASDFIG